MEKSTKSAFNPTIDQMKTICEALTITPDGEEKTPYELIIGVVSPALAVSNHHLYQLVDTLFWRNCKLFDSWNDEKACIEIHRETTSIMHHFAIHEYSWISGLENLSWNSVKGIGESKVIEVV